MLREMDGSSAAVIGRLTRRVQSGGLSIGQGDSLGFASASPVWYPVKLPDRQSSARGVTPARSSLRSTYRQTVRKWSLDRTGKNLKRPS
jgi:hypothetical protein